MNDKYRLYAPIASGGMGVLHLGRLFASGGFRRIVAIKRMHPHLAADESFLTAFLDEARIASRIHHPNVLAPLDVVSKEGQVLVVFDYVLGLSLSELVRAAKARGERIPERIGARILIDTLHGLEAAHDVTSETGEPLDVVHRDVSPQNVLVGRDGAARLLDFGVAKARGRAQVTEEGIIKGKRGYMAPEQFLGQATQASDLYAAGVMLWELLAGRRFSADGIPRAPGPIEAASGSAYDAIAIRALAYDAADRFETAGAMAGALEAIGAATTRDVGEWVRTVGAALLEQRARRVADVEAMVEPEVDLGDAALKAPVAASDLATAPPASLSKEAAPTRIEPARRSRIAWTVGTAGAALIALVGFGALGRELLPITREAASGAASTLPAAESAPAPASPASSAPVAPAVPASASPTTVSAATASAARAPTAPPIARPSPTTKRSGCFPYIVDKNGQTRFNEACLR